MLGHSVIWTRETDLREFEKKLGSQAELGVAFQLLDVNGIVLKEDGYRATTPLPMASTKKIGIALTVLIHCYAPDNKINLDQTVPILQHDLSPGFPNNPLDQYYFQALDNNALETISPNSIDTPIEQYYFDAQEQIIIAEPTIADLLRYMLINSDNTSTDKLLEIIGGEAAVNSILHSYECNSYKLARNSRNLLGSIFGMSPKLSPLTNALWRDVLETSVDNLHYETEVWTYENGKDACSPYDMTMLLNLIARSSSGGRQSQLNEPAVYILGLMRQCKTGEHRIKDILNSRGDVDFVAHKTGTLGGVANDAAIIKFIDGQQALITVYTAYSDVDIKVRENVIADIAKLLVKQYKPIVRLDNQYSVSF